jgi:hypothetical protein
MFNTFLLVGIIPGHDSFGWFRIGPNGNNRAFIPGL